MWYYYWVAVSKEKEGFGFYTAIRKSSQAQRNKKDSFCRKTEITQLWHAYTRINSVLCLSLNLKDHSIFFFCSFKTILFPRLKNQAGAKRTHTGGCHGICCHVEGAIFSMMGGLGGHSWRGRHHPQYDDITQKWHHPIRDVDWERWHRA